MSPNSHLSATPCVKSLERAVKHRLCLWKDLGEVGGFSGFTPAAHLEHRGNEPLKQSVCSWGSFSLQLFRRTPVPLFLHPLERECVPSGRGWGGRKTHLGCIIWARSWHKNKGFIIWAWRGRGRGKIWRRGKEITICCLPKYCLMLYLKRLTASAQLYPR